MPRGTIVARIAVLTALAAVLAAGGAPPTPGGPVQVEIDGISAGVLASERFAGVYDCGANQVDVRVTVGTTTAGDDFVLVVPQRDWGGDLLCSRTATAIQSFRPGSGRSSRTASRRSWTRSAT